jgi:hypothetical protein
MLFIGGKNKTLLTLLGFYCKRVRCILALLLANLEVLTGGGA